jgi:hypothetical protein
MKYVLCLPQGGLNDMCFIIDTCLDYCKKYNRILVIDTRFSVHFKDSIHKYLEINDPDIYKGDLTEFYNSINENTSIFPEYIKPYIHNLNISYNINGYYHNTIGPLTFNTDIDYEDEVLLYVNCGGGYNIPKFFYTSLFKPIIKDVLLKRLSELPDRYTGIHIRNSDIKTDVTKFIEDNHSNLKESNIFIASDDSESIELFKSIFKEKCYNFSKIPNYRNLDRGWAGIQLINRSPSEHEEYNIDTLCDLLLLGLSYDLIISSGGFSILSKSLFNDKPLIMKMLNSV